MGHNSINMKILFADFISRKFVVGLLFLGGLSACGSSSTDKFREAMNAGSLSEAQDYLVKINDKTDCKQCALHLMNRYI